MLTKNIFGFQRESVVMSVTCTHQERGDRGSIPDETKIYYGSFHMFRSKQRQKYYHFCPQLET